MPRWVLAVGVTLSLVSDAAAAAQQRTAPSPPPPPAVTAPASPSTPAASSRFTSRLTFDGRAVEPVWPLVPFVGASRALPFPGFPFVWGWDSVTAADDARVAPPPLTSAPTGGVQLDVLPWRASVFLDGVYVGRVEDFRGYYHHLDASAGPHQIAIVEPGYEPLLLDLVVPAGRTTTYRGTLNQALTR